MVEEMTMEKKSDIERKGDKKMRLTYSTELSDQQA